MPVRQNKKEQRIARAGERMRRVVRLRASGAPAWIVKSEQVAMVLWRKGFRHRGVGTDFSNLQAELYARHVTPLMGDYSAPWDDE